MLSSGRKEGNTYMDVEDDDSKGVWIRWVKAYYLMPVGENQNHPLQLDHNALEDSGRLQAP
jgi:hypothetical protein